MKDFELEQEQLQTYGETATAIRKRLGEIAAEREALPCRGVQEEHPCQEASEERAASREERVGLPCREGRAGLPCRVAWEAHEADREVQEERAAGGGGRVECFRRSCIFLLNSPKAATFPRLRGT